MNPLVNPEIPKQLLNFLDETFPDSLKLATRPDWSLEQAIGARKVIDLLIDHYTTQQEDTD